MGFRNFFRIPYGYRENVAFESKQSKCEKAMEENNSINKEQNDKIASEIDRSTSEDNEFKKKVEMLVEKDASIDLAINQLSDKDKTIDEAISKLVKKDESIDGSINTLVSKDKSLDLDIATLRNADIRLDSRLSEVEKTVPSLSDFATKEEVSLKADKVELLELSDKVGSIVLEKSNDLEYSLKVNGESKGLINIPKDQFLKNVSYDESTYTLKFSFVTADSDNNEVDVNVKNLVDTYTNGDGLSLSENKFSILINPRSDRFLVVGPEGLAIKGLEEALNAKLDVTEHNRVKNLIQENLKIKANKEDIADMATMSWVNEQNYLTVVPTNYITDEELLEKKYLTEHQNIDGKLDVEVYNSDKLSFATKEDIKNNVNYTNIGDESMPDRKSVVLENHDALMGKSSAGLTNIAMISKFDVADFGSKAVHCNLNGKYPRPTYNDVNPIALAEDIFNCEDSTTIQFNVLMDKLAQLEEKVSKASESTYTKIEGSDLEVNENHPEQNYLISGNLSDKVSVTGNNISVKDMSVVDCKKHTLVSDSGEINMSNCSYTGSHDRNTDGNTVVSINSNDIVNIRDCKFNTNTYNEVEVSLGGEYCIKGLNMDNCVFGGSKSNNAISLFGFKDNAVINFTNCVFEDVSNPIRISNKTNAKNVTFNFINCKVNKWESRPESIEYAGFACLQDYTSKTNEEAMANKQFATMTLNFVNLETPNGRLFKPSDISEVCGSKDSKQLIYVYYNNGGLIPYSKEDYPTVNII